MKKRKKTLWSSGVPAPKERDRTRNIQLGKLDRDWKQASCPWCPFWVQPFGNEHRQVATASGRHRAWTPPFVDPPLKQRVYTSPNDCLPVYRKTCGARYIQRLEEPFAAGEVGRSKSGSWVRTLRLMSSLLRLGLIFKRGL